MFREGDKKRASVPSIGTKGCSFRGTTQIRAGRHALDAPVTEGLRPCLHGGSRANQTVPPQSGLQPVTGPLLAVLTVIFPFIADNTCFISYQAGNCKRKKPGLPDFVWKGETDSSETEKEVIPFLQHSSIKSGIGCFDEIKKRRNKKNDCGKGFPF